MNKDTTITMNRSMVEKIYQALRYGRECARERKRYEGIEAAYWDENSVPFVCEPSRVMGYGWVSELVRRDVNEQRLSLVIDLLEDVLSAEELSHD